MLPERKGCSDKVMQMNDRASYNWPLASLKSIQTFVHWLYFGNYDDETWTGILKKGVTELAVHFAIFKAVYLHVSVSFFILIFDFFLLLFWMGKGTCAC